MHHFNIYTQTEKRTEKQIEAVKLGWSWPGFFFGGYWALVKKLWRIAAGLLFVQVVGDALYIVAEEMIEEGNVYGGAGVGLVAFLVVIGSLVLAGAKGNDWRASRLERRGYKSQDIISAENAKKAVAVFEKDARNGTRG